MLLRGLGRSMREYPLLTVIGVYASLYCVGMQIAARIFGRNPNHYEFGDATVLTLQSLAAFLGKPLGDCEVGDVTAASLASLGRAFRRARGLETREAIGYENMVASFFQQAAVLAQRCLDRGFLAAADAEAAAADSGGAGGRVRVALAAAVLLNTALRSVEDDVARESDAFVTAAGNVVVPERVPPALKHILAQTVEAKALLRRARPDADARAALCAAVVRAGVAGDGARAADPVAAALLGAAAALRAQLPTVFDANMEDVFVAVVEDRWGHFDDGALGDHLLPARRRRRSASHEEHPGAV